MADKLMKSIAKSITFAVCTSLIISLLISLLIYFEIIGVDLASKILYAAFILIIFGTTFITARNVGSKGLVVGLVSAAIITVLSAMYRLVGVEIALDLAFTIRTLITFLVSIIGAVVGVNTVK